MPSRKNTHIILLLCMAAVCTREAAFAAVDDATFTEAKDAYTEVWKAAAETTKRRQELEATIKQSDSKVEKAKQDLQKATQDRLDVRMQIDERRKLIAALTEQIAAVNDSRTLYQGMADEQRDEFVAFVRLMAARQIEVADTGPVMGGSVMRRMLRGSLGESIQQELNRNALLRARATLLEQLNTIALKTDGTKKRLQTLAVELEKELVELAKRDNKLEDSVGMHAAALDETWKAKVLSQQELEQVQAETAGVSGKVMEMQANLLAINLQLKESKLNELREKLAAVQAQETELQDKKKALLLLDKHWRDVQDEEPAARQATVDKRNTEPKLYKRIEDLELTIKAKEAEMTAQATGSGSQEDSSTTRQLAAQIDTLKEQLALMETGVPTDVALDYVKKKQAAHRASIERGTLASQIDAMNVQISAANDKVSAVLSLMETTEKNSALGDLPPLFGWPVNGRLTAGYYDPDYVAVFHVEHKAVDIAVPQGTPVRTVADGVVYAVKQGGATGYTYVLIGHREGFSSLYGHLSQVFVKAGDVIEYGHVIGLSGGLPGTNGAGPQTTGAHVHLEMQRNGVHFNPLDVLGKG
jgi:murein DD-endopeptidase MepM/ murein hydrolase activator NlpD